MSNQPSKSDKIAYVSVYGDGTGYAKAAIEYIMSLDAAGASVAARTVKMTHTYGEVPRRLIEAAEANSLEGVRTVIQHNLPSEFCYCGGVQNIGMFAYETDSVPYIWKNPLLLMDKLVVFSNQQKNAIICDKLLKKKFNNDNVAVIGHSVDTNRYLHHYTAKDFGVPANYVKFYTVAEISRRKNLYGLLLAYFLAFNNYDNVALIIKTHVPGRSQQEGASAVKALIDSVKADIRKYRDNSLYPKVIFTTGFVSDDEINVLHASCDIFVTTSHGEAWCLPAVDALGFGNHVVAPNFGSFVDYLAGDSNLGTLVNGKLAPVLGQDFRARGLYNYDEMWYNVDILDTVRALRQARANVADLTSDAARQARTAFVTTNYSRQVIGQKLLEFINK